MFRNILIYFPLLLWFTHTAPQSAARPSGCVCVWGRLGVGSGVEQSGTAEKSMRSFLAFDFQKRILQQNSKFESQAL